MSVGTRSSVQALYEETARELATRVVERFRDAVHSVVLYGSVARGTAGKDSDIDVLLVSDVGEALRGQLADVSGDLEYERDYETLFEALILTPGQLTELAEAGFPIADEVLKEGVVLYDDGTFERIRKKAATVGG